MSTKIIHVLKNDDFDEVFEAFKNLDAEEVIFVFPRGSRFAGSEQYFEAIQREAETTGRKISIMTVDPKITGYASNLGIELLKNPEPKQRKTRTESMAQLTVARNTLPRRTKIMKDIVRPEPQIQQPVQIREEKMKSFNVELKRGFAESHNAVNDITQVWSSRDQETAVPKSKSTQTRKNFKKMPLFFIAGAVIVLFLILYSTLGNARIIIEPQKQQLDFRIKATASTTATSVDPEFNRLPGQGFGQEEKESGTAAATGQKDVIQKAGGKITIYNKSRTPQTLVATTRFETPSGLIYRIPNTVTVPPATNSGEGSIESAVYADKAGEEYNIGPSSFTIPGFKGSPKFNEFYAKSDQSITGGIIGPSKVITEEDFAGLQENLTAKLREKIMRSLEERAGGLKIIDSTAINYKPPESNARIGMAAEKLEMSISGSASAIAFRESDVLDLVKNYISGNSSLELIEDSLLINYLNPKNSADGSAVTFDIHVTGQAATAIDQKKILEEVPGMSEETVRDYFKNIKEIESARIVLSPFWVKNIPNDPAKIRVEIDR